MIFFLKLLQIQRCFFETLHFGSVFQDSVEPESEVSYAYVRRQWKHGSRRFGLHIARKCD